MKLIFFYNIFWIIPLIQLIISTISFLKQGGFAGGDGKYDLLFFLIELPGSIIFLFPEKYLPLIFTDYINIVIIPIIINISILIIIFFTLKKIC
jgi:hypothetical protein